MPFAHVVRGAGGGANLLIVAALHEDFRGHVHIAASLVGQVKLLRMLLVEVGSASAPAEVGAVMAGLHQGLVQLVRPPLLHSCLVSPCKAVSAAHVSTSHQFGDLFSCPDKCKFSSLSASRLLLLSFLPSCATLCLQSCGPTQGALGTAASDARSA